MPLAAGEPNGLTNHDEKVGEAQLPRSADRAEVLDDPHAGALEAERYILVGHELLGHLRVPLDDVGGVVDIADEDSQLWSLKMHVLLRHGRFGGPETSKDMTRVGVAHDLA